MPSTLKRHTISKTVSEVEKVYEVVRQIPKGKVCTYGQVARLAGNPRWARVVGYALHQNSEFGKIAPGYAADFLLLTLELDIESVYIDGEKVL